MGGPADRGFRRPVGERGAGVSGSLQSVLIYTPRPCTDRPQLYRNNKHDPGTNDPGYRA